MAGTQAPKGFGLLFVLVGVPLILWSAVGTNKELAELDTPEAREAQCRAKAADFELSEGAAEGFCGCLVREADKRGLNREHGSYDEAGLIPVVELCYQTSVVQEPARGGAPHGVKFLPGTGRGTTPLRLK